LFFTVELGLIVSVELQGEVSERKAQRATRWRVDSNGQLSPQRLLDAGKT
jgi:hypothetical protein